MSQWQQLQVSHSHALTNSPVISLAHSSIRSFTRPATHPNHSLAQPLIQTIHSPSHSPQQFTRPATHPNYPLAQPLTPTIHSPSHSPQPFTRPATHPNHPLAQPLTQTNHSFRLRPASTRPSATHPTQNLPNLARTPSLAQPLAQLTQPAKLMFPLVCFPHLCCLRSPFHCQHAHTLQLSICKSKHSLYYTNQTHSVKYISLLNT
jgi:hypothetical protein